MNHNHKFITPSDQEKQDLMNAAFKAFNRGKGWSGVIDAILAKQEAINKTTSHLHKNI